MTRILDYSKATKRIARCFRSPVFAAVAAFVVALATFGISADPAAALPSFARQTGQTCSACHTAFPQLTPFGRRFKLGGYTLEGGDSQIPPLAMMVQSTYTRFNKDQPAPFGTGYGSNDLVDGTQQISLFYGGKILGNVGAFVQYTFQNGPGRAIHLDLTDIRYADSTKLGSLDVLYGLTLNNNPTVQDIWNTTPAWSSPFILSNFANPLPTTMLESFGPNNTIGSGGYVFINDMLYLEVAGYSSLTSSAQAWFGVSPNTANTIDGVAPYWRAALEHNWGDHSLMFGTYGMAAQIYPGAVAGFGTDKITDVGFDSQYQWISDMHAVTLRANFIFEKQVLDSSFFQGNTSNPTDYLRSLKLSAEYVYDHSYAITGTYFQYSGSPDALVYSASNYASPNTSGWIADVAYLPFSHGAPGPWPWLNTRIGVSYTWYNAYYGSATNIGTNADGSMRNARDNNTLLIYAFTAF